MALGKPVVAFGVGGIGEMVEDGLTGEVVRFVPDGRGGAAPESVERLAAAFVAYAGDAERRSRQGAAGRARVLTSFDARAHACAIEAEIRAACGTELR